MLPNEIMIVKDLNVKDTKVELLEEKIGEQLVDF